MYDILFTTEGAHVTTIRELLTLMVASLIGRDPRWSRIPDAVWTKEIS